jgi:hypothetical protein
MKVEIYLLFITYFNYVYNLFFYLYLPIYIQMISNIKRNIYIFSQMNTIPIKIANRNIN